MPSSSPLYSPSISYYTINLVSSRDRRLRQQRQITSLTKSPLHPFRHHFIKAIDGKTLNLPSSTNLKPGEIGLYLTTLEKVLPTAIQNTNQITVIFEDDVNLHPNTPKIFQEAIASAPEDWDILYFGCNQTHFADPIGLVSTKKSETYAYELCPSTSLNPTSSPGWSQVISERCITGNWAYALNPKGAQKILYNLRHMEQPIDVAIDSLIDRKVIKGYCATPELVSLHSDDESTIRSSSNLDRNKATTSFPWVPLLILTLPFVALFFLCVSSKRKT